MLQILIVDDEPLTLEYLERFLSGLFIKNSKILLAQNGRDALELMQNTQVDLVISDIRMPVVDGLDLALHIRERKQTTRVILLTGYEDFNYAQQALKYGVRDYLLKPINKEELALAVQKQIEGIRQEKQHQLDYLRVFEHSEAYRTLVGQNLVGSIAHQENLRLQQYYKLACQLSIDEIQADGAILLLEVDRWQNPLSNISAREQGIFSMILAQQASDVMSRKHIGGFSLPDQDGKTLIYLTGDDHLQVQKQAHALYDWVSQDLQMQLGISVSGALGRIYSDVLQMDLSYQQARSLLVQRIVDGRPCLQLCRKSTDTGFYDRMYTLFSDLYSYGRKGRDIDCNLLLDGFIQIMPDFESETVQRFGLFLAESLFSFMQMPEPVALDGALALLKNGLAAGPLRLEPQKVKALLYDLTLKLCAPSVTEENHSRLTTLAKQYIYQHYGEPISLALLAEEMGVSESYLSNLFHRETGESYIKFLTRVRMEKAAELLRTQRGAKVYEVARQVGYFNAKHFNHVFKQWLGTSPNEYQLRFF